MIKPASLLILLGIIWGSGYSIARYAMTHGVSPLGYAFWQSWGPVIFLLAFLFWKKIPLYFSKRHLRYYFITGLLGIAVPNTTMYFTAAHLPAGILAVIVNTVPILAYPLALTARLERFSFLRIIGIIIGISGILCMVLPKTSLPSADMIPWACLALVSPLCFASCAIYSTYDRPHNSSSASLSFGMLLCAAILLTPLVFWSHQFFPLTPPYTAAHGVVVLEILLSSIGYILFFALLNLAGPVYYSLVGGLVGLTGLFWGRVLYQEHLSMTALFAVVLIFIAILLVSLNLRAYVKTP